MHCWGKEFPSLSWSRLVFAIGRICAWFGRWIEEKPLCPELAAGGLRQMRGSPWLPGELLGSPLLSATNCDSGQELLRDSWEFLYLLGESEKHPLQCIQVTEMPMAASLSMRGSFLELRKLRKMPFPLPNLFYPKCLAQLLSSQLIPKIHEHISMVSCENFRCISYPLEY